MLKQVELREDALWEIIRAYLEDEGLVQHHLKSYNWFLKEGLNELVKSLGELEIQTKYGVLTLKIRGPEVGKPVFEEVDGTVIENITPMECRLRNLTYAAPLYVEMMLYLDGKPVLQKPEKVKVGIVPIMVKSDICPLSKMSDEELMEIGEDPKDPGGYFIINGSERVIVAIEDLAPNRILVTEKDVEGSQFSAVVISAAHGRQARTEVTCKANGPVKVFFSRIYKGIPAIIMLRALGMTNDREILSLVSPLEEVQELLQPSFEEAEGIETEHEALRYIGNRIAFGYAEEYRIQRAEQLIDSVLLPHIGTNKVARYKKAIFLCEMIGRLLETSLGIRKPTDRDHYANKRLKLAGPLLMELYRMAFMKLLRDVRYQLERAAASRYPVRISTFVRPGIITDFVKHAFATGNWPGGRVGLTQLLNRTNHLATISHLRRVQSPLSRSQPHFEARDLHGTHWGRICPAETPEGSNCGLVKNLALTAEISYPVKKRGLLEKLYSLGVVPLSEIITMRKRYNTKVFVDGLLTGYHTDGEKLVEVLRDLRRRREISLSVNVALYKFPHVQEVWINTDEGRVRRPLIIVKDGKPLLTEEHIKGLKDGTLRFRDLISMGVIEFLDAEEEENALIALRPEDVTREHTHLEICPYAMLGAVVSIIPYAEHNQSPRNIYEGAMGKQALGVFAINHGLRVDSRSHILVYPQKPIVITRSMDMLDLYSRPIGQNMIVAILTGQGYNMEDAVVLNKSAVERGLALSLSYRVYEVEARTYIGGEKDVIRIPEPTVRGYRGEHAYRVLDADGLAHIEADVNGGTVIVGVQSPPRFLEEYQRAPARELIWRDSSETVRPSEAGVVEAIFLTKNEEGNKLVKAKVRSFCVAEIGDKFASRHGQKGVVGMLLPQEDMPYTESGIVPDLIINPHAFPSRMTIGQLLESIAGKVASLKGEFIDGTPFMGKSVNELRAELERLGFKSSGKEVMYDGLTGKKFETEIFVGVVYYQKLHHLVRDKIHARSRGRVQMLTRQPTEGRSRGGGLKFGEMERDCLIAHGASFLLLDRLLEQSDRYTAYFCKLCGLPAYYDLKQERFLCPVHGKNAEIATATLPYAFYLLLEEMMSMGIYPRLLFGEEG